MLNIRLVELCSLIIRLIKDELSLIVNNGSKHFKFLIWELIGSKFKSKSNIGLGKILRSAT